MENQYTREIWYLRMVTQRTTVGLSQQKSRFKQQNWCFGWKRRFKQQEWRSIRLIRYCSTPIRFSLLHLSQCLLVLETTMAWWFLARCGSGRFDPVDPVDAVCIYGCYWPEELWDANCWIQAACVFFSLTPMNTIVTYSYYSYYSFFLLFFSLITIVFFFIRKPYFEATYRSTQLS